MSEFTSRDRWIAILLCWGLLLAFAAVLIFMDGFKTVERLYTDVLQTMHSGGLMVFEVQWFACLAITLAMFLWGNRVRAGLLRMTPSWLALLTNWLFSIICGVLGCALYLFNIFLISDMEDSVLIAVQGGILSMGFALLAIGGTVRPLPTK